MISEFPVFTGKIEHAHTVYTRPSLSQREGPGDEAGGGGVFYWDCDVGLVFYDLLIVFLAELHQYRLSVLWSEILSFDNTCYGDTTNVYTLSIEGCTTC